MTDPYNLCGRHPADRVMRTQAISLDLTLRGDPPPTPRQVAAVMHALADHTHNQHMLGDAVKALGADRSDLGPGWEQTTGLGRYFHALGDWLEGRAFEAEQTREAMSEQDIDRACAWSDYRKDYGVSADDQGRTLEAKAFRAGWDAALGRLDAGGVQR